MSARFIFSFAAGVMLLGLGRVHAADTADYKAYSYQSASYIESESVREDTGDLSPRENKSLADSFRMSAAMRSLSLTNGAVQGSNSESGVIVIPSLQLGFKAPIGAGFGVDALVALETLANVNRGSRSFWGPSADLKLDYRFSERAPRVWIGVEPYWFGNFDGDQIAEAIGYAAGTDYSRPFNRSRSLFTGGYSFTTYAASPSQDDRDTHRAFVAVAHQFAPALIGQLFYQFQHANYTNQDGADLRNIVGGSMIYRFTPHIVANVSLSYVDNNSTRPLADYEAFAVGAGVGFEF